MYQSGDTRNLIITIILATLVIAGWHFWYEVPAIEKAKIAEAARRHDEAATHTAHHGLSGAPSNVIKGNTLRSREDVLSKELKAGTRALIRSERLSGSISLKGARFDDLVLSTYHLAVDDRQEVSLLSPVGAKDVYFSETGWVAKDKRLKLPNAQTLWEVKKGTTLTPTSPLELSWNNGEGLVFHKMISMDEYYLFSIEDRVENYGAKEVTLLPYARINRAWVDDHPSYVILHEGALGVLDKTLNETTYKKLKDKKKQTFTSTHGWFGITDKYWLTSIIPDTHVDLDVTYSYTQQAGADIYQADYVGEHYHLPAQSSYKVTTRLFAGAKEINLLEAYAETYQIDMFDRAVDFGKLFFLTKPLLYAIKYLYGLSGNFGLAIILLTLAIKLLLFPLAQQSYISMTKMKRLQPKIKEIRESCPDDKMELQRRIAGLYKSEKVQPLAGCLPILIQIPIFFSLYKVLFISIEMRHAPFYGWIHDLSIQDPTTIFNLFGLLDFDPTLSYLRIGAWPILMAITMAIQQRLQPPAMDPTQDMVMKLLPLIFVFIFASFPAGLIIYWTCNNVLSILQQAMIMKRTKN